MKNLEQTVNKIVDKALEGYKVMPPMDKDKYPEMPGLEGPFTLMSGKVVYYDPKEGAHFCRSCLSDRGDSPAAP